MLSTQTEDMDGLLVTQTNDRLVLRASLRTQGLGALSWCLLFWVPLFLLRLVLISAHIPVSTTLNALLTLGGPCVWLVAFAYFVSRPSVSVRRDGRFYEGDREVAFLQKSGVIVLSKKNYLYLGYGPAPEDSRLGRHLLFTKADEARRVADRINGFLGYEVTAPPKL